MKLSTLSLVAAVSMAGASASTWALSAPEPAVASTPSVGFALDPSDVLGALGRLGGQAEFVSGTTLTASGRLGHAVLAAGRPAETFLFLDLKAAEDTLAATAPRVNIAIVVDRSGSMRGQRLDNAMAAARGMVQRLRIGDTVSVVAYNTATSILIPPTRIDEASRADVMLGLRRVEAAGNTCISCGIEAGMELLRRRTGAVNRMLLLSDGEANAGVKDVAGFHRLAARARDQETSISSIGVDVDYNERVMFAIAQSSNGRHYFVENPAGLARVFHDELKSLVSTVASEAEAEITLADGVEVTKVFARELRREGNRLRVPFGTFAAGDDKSLLIALRLPQAPAGVQAVADVRLRYADLIEGTPAECEGALVARRTRDAAEVSSLDPLVENRLARAETATALFEANERFSRGDLEGARTSLDETRGRIRARRKTSKKRAKPSDVPKLDASFGEQLGALDDAAVGFEQASKVAPTPAAAPSTREGRSSVRANAESAQAFH